MKQQIAMRAADLAAYRVLLEAAQGEAALERKTARESRPA
jgi:hypothetical protein